MKYGEKWRETITEELSMIADLSRDNLIELWMAAHGTSPPKGISRRLLEYNAAYAVQVKVHGGLKPTVRRKLERTASLGKINQQAEKPSEQKMVSPGTRLVRDWHGRTYTVDVVEGGFRYGGRDYNSLSQVAREITGTRWSGPRFFGL